MSVFPERLRQLRATAGKKQSEVAEVIGASTQSYSTYESGREPRYQMLCQLCDYFGVTSDYLLGRNNSPTAEQQIAADKLGLSAQSVTTLMELQKDAPELLKRQRMLNYLIESAFDNSLLELLYDYFFSTILFGNPDDAAKYDNGKPVTLTSMPFVVAQSEDHTEQRLGVRGEDFSDMFLLRIQKLLMDMKEQVDTQKQNKLFRSVKEE